MIKKIKRYILGHKIISALFLILIVIGSYFFFNNKTDGEISYITEKVEKGNIIRTVSGTGQVEASNTLDLKAKTTGDITYVGVNVGQNVKKGKLIASVDSRDAKNALENAQINLTKLKKGPDTLTLLQKENSLDELYDNGWNDISSFISEMIVLIDDLEEAYNSNGYFGYKNVSKLSSAGKIKVNLAEDNYYQAEKNLEEVVKLYKTLQRSSDKEDLDLLIQKIYESSKIIANTIKNTEEAFNYMVKNLEYENDSETELMRQEISSWMTASNKHVNNFLSLINNIKENTQSLKDVISGTDELDIRSAELSLMSKQDAYNDCFIYAPFDGVIATLTAKVGESSGSSIGTLITNQKMVNVSFNEVDVTSIKLGQKSIITFDAISDLSISGTVAEIDAIGTVSSGVVTYKVKIAFDSEDERIKPGMSANTEIIIQEKNDILVVSNSAIKTRNKKTYVEVSQDLNSNSNNKIKTNIEAVFTRRDVEIGISDDLKTEIISGLIEGDEVVVKTVNNTGDNSKSSSTTPSILNSVGGTRGMGGNMPRN